MRIQNVLLARIAAQVRGNQLVVGQHFDDEWIGAQREMFASFVGGHGIAVRLEGDLAVPVQGDFPAHTACKWMRWQRVQQRLFHLPVHTDRLRLAVDDAPL